MITAALTPTLLDYLGVSQIQNKSSGLPYSLPNLPDKSEFGYFFIKDEKSSKFGLKIKKNIGFSFHGCLYFCEMLLDFGLCVHFSDFQLVRGRLGLSPKKWSFNRFRGVGWCNGF